jgi:hypothetical protein
MVASNEAEKLLPSFICKKVAMKFTTQAPILIYSPHALRLVKEEEG